MAITKVNNLGITFPVPFTAGTAALPSLTFSGDTNTGIFAPAADTIGFTEGGVEGMRLNASGNVQFAGNIGLGGTTPTTSGTGITFPATQSASTDANTLDDYEEGTWTPIITAGFTGTPTYSERFGRYTKIGNRVFVIGAITVSNVTAAGTTLQYGGLPFTVASSDGSAGMYFGYNRNLFTSGTGSLYITIDPNGTIWYITNTNGQGINGNSASITINGNNYLFQGSYYI